MKIIPEAVMEAAGVIVNNQKIVLGIAGEMLSGKTTAALYFEQKHGAKTFRFSSILNKILDVLDLPQSRENQQALVTVLREKYGEDVLAMPIVGEVEKLDNGFILIDGFRKKSEVDKLRKIHGFKLLYIKSPLELRYERLKKRNEKIGENSQSFEQFQLRQEHQADRDIQALEALADFVLENSSTVDEFDQKLEQLFLKL